MHILNIKNRHFTVQELQKVHIKTVENVHIKTTHKSAIMYRGVLLAAMLVSDHHLTKRRHEHNVLISPH